jgi:hypothetical protein
MTDLSSAAQQIFWEFNRAASGKPDDWHCLPAIAAALRAAADQCAYKREIHPDSSIAEMIIEADDILAIAAELETFTTETDD